MSDTNASLGRLVRRGAAWSSVDVLVNRASSFALGIVVARLLTPKDFGVYAVALVVHTIVINVSELGVSSALIRDSDEAVDAAAPTVNTIALVTSVLLGVLMAVTAPALARVLGSEQAAAAIRVMAITLPLAGISAVPGALLRRNFRMDRLFVAGFLNTAGSAAVVIVLALMGLGPLALAWSFVAGQLLSTVLILIVAPKRYGVGWDRQQARALLTFGLPLAGTNILGFSIQNVDYIIVGRLLGSEALGLYMLAFNMSGWPQNVFSSVVRSVTLPAFARMHHDGRDMPRELGNALRLVGRITLPVCFFLAALAHPLVHLVYGDKWSAAAAPLVVLAVLASMRTIIEVFSDFLVSLARTKPVMFTQVLWLPALTVGLLFAVPRFGIVGAGGAHALVAALVVMPAFLYVLAKANVSLGIVARSLLPVLAWSGATAALAFAIASQIGPPFLACLAGGAIGLAVYLFPHLPAAYRQIAHRRRRRLSGEPAAEAAV